MASLKPRIWDAGLHGLTRRERRPCQYSVYIPDTLVGRRFVLDGDVAADIADAEADLGPPQLRCGGSCRYRGTGQAASAR